MIESSIMTAAKDGLFPWLEVRLSSNICCAELICLVGQTEHQWHPSHQSLCSVRKYFCSRTEFTCGNIINTGIFFFLSFLNPGLLKQNTPARVGI